MVQLLYQNQQKLVPDLTALPVPTPSFPLYLLPDQSDPCNEYATALSARAGFCGGYSVPLVLPRDKIKAITKLFWLRNGPRSIFSAGI